MGLSKGFAFRNTLGFVSDNAPNVFAGPAVLYSGGLGYGWNATGFQFGGDFNAALDHRIAGTMFSNAGGGSFKFDCPNGPIDVDLGLGSNSTQIVAGRITVGNGAVAGTDIFDITSGSSITNANSCDASGAILANTAWPASKTSLRVNCTRGFITLSKIPSAALNARFIGFSVPAVPMVDMTFKDESGFVQTPPTLYESQVSGKWVAQLIQAVGSPSNTTVTVTEADGVTPSLYLAVQIIAGVPWLVQTATRMPNLSGSYSFKIIQTDNSGSYTNSPYSQSCNWTVVAAPTKPYNDGSFLSKVSTGAFLARKKIVDIFNQPYDGVAQVGEWMGYQGGVISSTTTVLTTSAFITAMDTYTSMAASLSNTVFCVEIDSDITSDWATHEISPGGALGGAAWDFMPENGNVCLIRYKAAGNKPLLVGGWFTVILRGVHVTGLTWGMDNSATTLNGGTAKTNQAIHFNAFGSSRHNLLRIENCLSGLLFNPAYAGINRNTVDTTKLAGAFGAISNTSVGEQFIMKNCILWGTNGAFNLFGFRMVHLSNIDISLITDDCIAMEMIPASAAPYFPDLNQYEWFDGVHLRYIANAPNPTDVHADFLQQRILVGGTKDPSSVTYRLMENCTCIYDYTETTIDRNVCIVSDGLNLAACYLNNIFCHCAQRGIDTGCGTGVSYIEYNTLGIPALLPPTTTSFNQSIFASFAGSNPPAELKIRKNIYPASGGEGNVSYSINYPPTIDPNTIMNGPFIQDPNNAARMLIASINEATPSFTLAQHLASLQGIYTPKLGVDAGWQPSVVASNIAPLNMTTLLP